MASDPVADMTPEAVKRLGGYASPLSAHSGESGVTMGGLTVWDEYVIAIAPEIFKCAPHNAHQTEIAAGIATMADAILAERKKREQANAG